MKMKRKPKSNHSIDDKGNQSETKLQLKKIDSDLDLLLFIIIWILGFLAGLVVGRLLL